MNIISKQAIIGNNPILGHNVIIGDNAVIGNNVKIGHNSIIDNCIIKDNTTIQDNCIIGYGHATGWVSRATDAKDLAFDKLEISKEVTGSVCITTSPQLLVN